MAHRKELNETKAEPFIDRASTVNVQVHCLMILLVDVTQLDAQGAMAHRKELHCVRCSALT